MEQICDGCSLASADAEFDDCEYCGGHFCFDCYSQYHGSNCEERDTGAQS
jgi:hypothetical protein